jgi:hypothetical protein
MNQEERNELLARLETVAEPVYQVLKMLDKNLEETLDYGTDEEAVMITRMQKTLMNDAGFYGKEANIAIQYLTGRLTAVDFTKAA